MSNKRRAFTIVGHEFQWIKRKTLELCTDCAFHTPGPFASLCEESTVAFDCKEEKYGAWQEVVMGKQR